MFNFHPEQNYNDVIKSPFVAKKPQNIKNLEVVAEHEQDFLARIAPFLVQDSHQDSPLSSRLLHSESVLKTPERKIVGSPGVHSALRKTEYGAGKTINDGAISNFFHALLNKKTGASPVHGNAAAKFADDIAEDPVPGQTQISNIIKNESAHQTETKSWSIIYLLFYQNLCVKATNQVLKLYPALLTNLVIVLV